MSHTEQSNEDVEINLQIKDEDTPVQNHAYMQIVNEYHQHNTKTVLVNGESVVLNLRLLEKFLDKAEQNNNHFPEFHDYLKETVEKEMDSQHQEWLQTDEFAEEFFRRLGQVGSSLVALTDLSLISKKDFGSA